MVGQVVGPRELLWALGALEGPGSRMFGNVTLPIGLGGELKAAVVAHKRLDALVGPHVSLEQALPIVGLSAQITLEWPRPHPFMLPLVVLEVVLRHKAHLADLADKRLHALMLDPDVFVDARLVEHLAADRALGRQRGLLVVWHKVVLMLQPDVSGEARAVYKNLSAKVALFRHALVHLLRVPVQRPLSAEHFATVAKYLLFLFNWSVYIMDPLVLAEVRMPLEALAAHVAHQGRFSGVDADVLLQLVRGPEPLLAKRAAIVALFEVPFSMVPQKAGLRELLTTLEALEGLLLAVATHVLDHELLVLEGPVALVAHVLPLVVGHDVLDVCLVFGFDLQ